MTIFLLKHKTVIACYVTYFLSGIVILSFGAILPELIVEKGLSYTLAGGLLTCLTIGNFLSSVVYPLMCSKIEEKYVSTVMCMIYPICLFAFTITSSIAFLYVLIFLIGVNKGIITLVNNRVVNAATNNSVKQLNILHMSYAIGALLSPFIIAVFTRFGISWKTILRIVAICTIALPIIYYKTDISILSKNVRRDTDEVREGGTDKKKYAFFFMALYWIAAGMIFCYMGLENTVSGWFETYLRDRGILSVTMATIMVSVTWLMIMIGRIIIASISDKVRAEYILLAITFIQLIAVSMLIMADSAGLVVTSLVILGLGLAGIFPTVMSLVGKILNNSNVGMSVVTGFGSLGGILIPQIIGIVADGKGFSLAILLMLGGSVVLTLLGVVTVIVGTRRKRNETIYG